MIEHPGIEVIAEALYLAWCEGVKKMKPCFAPYPWDQFKEEEGKSGSIPTTEQFYMTAEELLGKLKGLEP